MWFLGFRNEVVGGMWGKFGILGWKSLKMLQVEFNGFRIWGGQNVKGNVDIGGLVYEGLEGD